MVIDRIRDIIDYKGISERAFCKEIGVANGFLNKVKDVGTAKLNKILYAYPEINPVWLLTGEGTMLVDNTGNVTPVADYAKLIDLVDACKESLTDSQYEELRSGIMGLINELGDSKNKVIALLEQQNAVIDQLRKVGMKVE